jgi:hypothetical protein
MPALQKCPGCLKAFTSQAAHLSQTSNPLCQRIASVRRSRHSHPVRRSPTIKPPLKLQRPAPSTSSPSSSLQSQSPALSTPSPLISPRPASLTPSGVPTDDSDLDEDELIDGLTERDALGWEPEVEPDRETRSQANHPGESDVEPPNDTPPEDVRHRAWTIPKIVQFPSSHAGEPIGTALPPHDAYTTSLKDPSSNSNPYGPFTSKIDWEVAKWVKLRGPSPTSFAKLLKIDRVW